MTRSSKQTSSWYLDARNMAASLALIVASPLWSDISQAAITVQVLDPDGVPVADVAVYVKAPGAGASLASSDTVAVMDQADSRFVPHLLVVQTGTLVEFPNSDTIAHHVYSFSHPNHFRLPLYKGDAHPPVRFDHEGVVTLGCNIHDNMLGFIAVVRTPHFAKTDSRGMAIIDNISDGSLEVSIWSPRIRDRADELSQQVNLSVADDAQLTFELRKALRPPHDELSEAITWAEY